MSLAFAPRAPEKAPEQTPSPQPSGRLFAKRSATKKKAALLNNGSQQTRTNYRPDIDGIRGAAAIMVMGYHAKVPGFDGAYIGLDLFFVVSGFVICGLLLGEFERTGRIKWSAFYARRARRLIPAKATMLVGVLLISYFVMSPTGSQQETAESSAAAAGFVSNFFFWKISDIDYFGHQPGTGMLLHTWSLSVEEQFYLALPAAILLAWGIARLLKVNVRRTLLFTCIALFLASLSLALAWDSLYPKAAYYLPMTRAFEFLMGVGLALVVAKVKLPKLVRHVLGLAGVVVIVAILLRPMPTEGYPSYWALLPCAATFAMVWAGCGSRTLATRLLSNRLFVPLGLVSYGWYLWHWPLLVMGESINLAPPPLWIRIGLVLLGLGFAVLSYKYIEGIFYNRSGVKPALASWGAPRIVAAGVVSMAIVAGLAGTALGVADDKAASPQWEAVAGQLGDVPELPTECVPPEFIIQQTAMTCYLNNFQEDRGTVVLWGDSHAWMYIPALEKAAAGQDVNLVAFTLGTCPPFDPLDLPRSQCTELNNMATDFVRDLEQGDEPVRVILGAAWENYFDVEPINLMDSRGGNPRQSAYVAGLSPYVRAGVPLLFEELGEIGVDVDVVAPIPEVPRNAPLCEAQTRIYSCDVDRADNDASEVRALRWLKKRMESLSGQTRLVDVSQELCDDKRCYSRIGDTLTYFDDNHLSASFSRNLGPYFEPSVQGAL